MTGREHAMTDPARPPQTPCRATIGARPTRHRAEDRPTAATAVIEPLPGVRQRARSWGHALRTAPDRGRLRALATPVQRPSDFSMHSQATGAAEATP